MGNKWGISESGLTYQKPVINSQNGDISKQWHVYFRYWDENTQSLVKARKSSIKGHLEPNRSKDPLVRYEQLGVLCRIIERLLSLDWNPTIPFPVSRLGKIADQEAAPSSISDGLQAALKVKNTEVSEDYQYLLKKRMAHFTEYLVKHNLANEVAANISRKHILAYLREVQATRGKDGKPASNKTRNGYLRDLSTVFTTMVNEEIIQRNPCAKVQSLPEKAGRHIPFSSEDIELFRQWAVEKEPYLYQYVQVVVFSFLRPGEILDLQIRDIDLRARLIYLRKESAKVDAVTIPIIGQLHETLSAMIPPNTPGKNFLFTVGKEPGPVKIAQTRYFSSRFNNWREYMIKEHYRDFTKDHTLYGMRHTFIQDIYHQLRKTMTKSEAEFKLMTITRHRTIDALRKYTRDYGLELAEDWSDKYSLKF